jgi:hypothetical protein
MSVTWTTIEETMRKLEAGDWEALSDIDQYSMVRIRNLRTGSVFTICIIDYRHDAEPKRKRANK